MAKAFKLIRTKAWETTDGKKGTTYTVVHAGRALTVNAEDFGDDIKVLPAVVAVPAVPASGTGANAVPAQPAIEAKDAQLVIAVAVEVEKEKYTNEVGESKIGLRLKPVFDIGLSILSA